MPKGPFAEFSVVYTDRVFNLMSPPFQAEMRKLSQILKNAYHGSSVALIPGSGSYAMESVARQFGTDKKCMVLRNGFFSFRWSEIFSVCKIPSEEIVLHARATSNERNPTFQPMPIDEVVSNIQKHKPNVFFAPHVETATGILLPDDYIRRISDAVHAEGGVFVLDDIAAGCVWVDMEKLGVDVLVTAPQKGWSAPASVGVVVLSKRGEEEARKNRPTSFCCNLIAWLDVMN